MSQRRPLSRRGARRASEKHARGRAKRRGSRVYVITDGEAIKIGISKDPTRRLRDLQTANSRPLDLALVIDPAPRTALVMERRIHKRCKRFRLHGEWFHLDALPVVLALADPGSGASSPEPRDPPVLRVVTTHGGTGHQHGDPARKTRGFPVGGIGGRRK